MSNNKKTKKEILEVLRKEHKKYYKMALSKDGDYSYNIGMSRGICKAMELIGMLKDCEEDGKANN